MYLQDQEEAISSLSKVFFAAQNWRTCLFGQNALSASV